MAAVNRDQQIGAMIAAGRLQALFFFVDPLSPRPLDVDVKALTRLAVVYDFLLAMNRATAERLIGRLARPGRGKCDQRLWYSRSPVRP